MLRNQVLDAYKKIVRVALNWSKHKQESTFYSIKLSPLEKSSQVQPVNEKEIRAEKAYIINEARHLFRLNRDVCDDLFVWFFFFNLYKDSFYQVKSEHEIREHLKEANARLDLALFYGLPYPRLPNVATGALASKNKSNRKKLKVQSKLEDQSRPIYLKSIYEEKK